MYMGITVPNFLSLFCEPLFNFILFHCLSLFFISVFLPTFTAAWSPGTLSSGLSTFLHLFSPSCHHFLLSMYCHLFPRLVLSQPSSTSSIAGYWRLISSFVTRFFAKSLHCLPEVTSPFRKIFTFLLESRHHRRLMNRRLIKSHFGASLAIPSNPRFIKIKQRQPLRFLPCYTNQPFIIAAGCHPSSRSLRAFLSQFSHHLLILKLYF